jgi:hypothetical protein
MRVKMRLLLITLLTCQLAAAPSYVKRGYIVGETLYERVVRIEIASEPDEYRVHQRASTDDGGESLGMGSVKYTVSLDTESDLYARVRSATDDSILQSPFLAISDAASGESERTIADIDARLGWFYVDFAPSASGPWTEGSNRIGMGRVVAMAGQSLASRMFDPLNFDSTTITGAGARVSEYTSIFATYDDHPSDVTTAAWTQSAETGSYDGAGIAEYLYLQANAHGVNCAIVGHVKGSTSILDFISPNTENTNLMAVLDALDGFEEFLWFQGHSEAGSVTSYSDYYARLSTLFADIDTTNDIYTSSAYSKVLSAVPNKSTDASWGDGDRVNVIRSAQSDWAAANSALFITPLDIDLIDDVHQTQEGSVDLARHFHRASLENSGLGDGDSGPALASGLRATDSAEIVLSVTHSGGSSLAEVGDGSTRFEVYNSGTTSSPLTINDLSIDNGSDEITLTLSAAPANDQAVDVWYGRVPDPADGTTDLIYDNDTDSDGLTTARHLMATVDPVVVAAPAGTPVGADLTMSSAGYTAAASGFGQSLNSGYGMTPTQDVFPESAPYAIECRFKTSGEASTGIFLGQGNNIWLGVDTDGELLVNVRTFEGGGQYMSHSAGVVDDGNWHHFALVADTDEYRAYLDGTLISTLVETPRSNSKNSVLGVRIAGWGSSEFDGEVDEVAVWSIEKYTGSSFTVPTAPLVGSETGLTEHWQLDGGGDTTIY